MIITWWFCLFIGIAINNLMDNNFKEITLSFEKIAGSLEILAVFAVGVPLVLCFVLKCLGKEVVFSKSLCIYGYS